MKAHEVLPEEMNGERDLPNVGSNQQGVTEKYLTLPWKFYGYETGRAVLLQVCGFWVR